MTEELLNLLNTINGTPDEKTIDFAATQIFDSIILEARLIKHGIKLFTKENSHSANILNKRLSTLLYISDLKTSTEKMNELIPSNESPVEQ